MRRWFGWLVVAAGYAACQCGPMDPCASTRCGPGLSCDVKTGFCVASPGIGAAFGWSRRLRKRITTPLSTPTQA